MIERPVPQPGRGEILIRLSAATLNYRDLALLTGIYKPGLQIERPFIPAAAWSRRLVPRCPAFAGATGSFRSPQGWISGQPTPEMRARHTLGFPLDGVLREYIAVPAEDAVHAPGHLTNVQAAALPIAGVTAWTALTAGGAQPGNWVLAMGTGGVAIFALQFAKAAGARVAVISSSDEKLSRARSLGADATFNYRSDPDWAPLVREATGGRGVDIVVDTAGTLSQSLSALACGGFAAIIGFTGGPLANLDIRQVIGSIVRMQGIGAGPRTSLEVMNRAIVQHESEVVPVLRTGG